MKNTFKPTLPPEPVYGADALTTGIWAGTYGGKTYYFIVDDESPSCDDMDCWSGIMQVEEGKLMRVHGCEYDQMSFVPYDGTLTLSNDK